ncbi:MAG: SagB family peptide dehydrogenase [Candidatus Acidiferrum sp.]
MTRQRTAGSALVAEVLGFCGEGRSVRELIEKFPEQGEHGLRAGIGRLLKYSLLEVCGKESHATDRRWAGWERWNPAAGFFHFSTKDSSFELTEFGEGSYLRSIAKLRPLPPTVKKYRGAAMVKLPATAAFADFPLLLTKRRTWREFSDEPVALEKLAELLWWSFGVQGWAEIPGVGRLVLKTSPSGGAMHPLEAYVLIRNVEGVKPGIYHYDAVGHRLELLRTGLSKGEIRGMLAGQRWAGDAAFVVLLTAMFERTQWKYSHARAYRVVLAEAGHVGQTFCLTGTWLGLAPFCTMALADTRIEKALGIDGVSESVLYTLGAGARPAGKATAERWKV